MKPIIAANWKMHKTIDEALEFAKDIKDMQTDNDVIIFAPAICLSEISWVLSQSKVSVGAQNMHDEEHGAFTGEISAEMVKSTGATHVLLGHSERRHIFGEDNAFINRKVHTALKHDLKTMVCIGETEQERNENKTNEVLKEQLVHSLKDISSDQMKMISLAYEPVWAIGTGNTATKEQANEAHQEVRKILTELYDEKTAQETPILYGGSVKPKNAKELLSQSDVNGALVGGASLDVKEFTKIVNAT